MYWAIFHISGPVRLISLLRALKPAPCNLLGKFLARRWFTHGGCLDRRALAGLLGKNLSPLPEDEIVIALTAALAAESTQEQETQHHFLEEILSM
jgi:hypothetical protein